MMSQTSRLSLWINQMREKHNPSLQAVIAHAERGLVFCGKFLKSCFTEGVPAIIEGRYTRKQAAVIIAGNLPTILGTLMVTIPGVIFPSPGQQAFYHFGSTLASDPVSLIPVGLGAVSSVLGLRIPIS